MLLNILGVKKVGKALTYVVSLTILTLLALAGATSFTADLSLLSPFAPEGVSGILSGAAMVFVSYAGVAKVAAIAGEIRNPEKNLPRGILISLLIVAIIYCLSSFMLAANIPYSQFQGDTHPIYTLSMKLGSYGIGVFVSFIAVLTMVSMANAGLLAASRFPFAMARDRLLPSVVGRLSPKFLTPILSIVMSGLVIALAILFLDIGPIAKLASAFLLLIYMVENFTVIVLRETRVRWYQPGYLSPLYPITQILGILFCLLLLVAMGEIVFIAYFNSASTNSFLMPLILITPFLLVR